MKNCLVIILVLSVKLFMNCIYSWTWIFIRSFTCFFSVDFITSSSVFAKGSVFGSSAFVTASLAALVRASIRLSSEALCL